MPSRRLEGCFAIALFVATCLLQQANADTMQVAHPGSMYAGHSVCEPCACKDGAVRHQQARLLNWTGKPLQADRKRTAYPGFKRLANCSKWSGDGVAKLSLLSSMGPRLSRGLIYSILPLPFKC
jgi:hypothetical protein